MSKSKERLLARELRLQGLSVRVIAKNVGVSVGSVSRWCQDILLLPEQIMRLTNQQRDGAMIGRIKGALTQKNQRKRQTEELLKKDMTN